MLPQLTVAFFTFSPDADHPRTKYARDCLGSLLLNLGYEGELRYHMADDGSWPGHVDNLAAMFGPDRAPPSHSDSHRAGYGASYNAMTNTVHGFPDELVLCVEDDWYLMRPLDLTPLARCLEDARINCVRLNYLGIAGDRSMRGYIIKPIPGQTMLLLDPECADYHLWSAGPRLETVAFQRQLGLFREHCSAGEMEIDVAGRHQAREGICWPLDFQVNASLDNPSTFAHVGTVSVKDEPVQ